MYDTKIKKTLIIVFLICIGAYIIKDYIIPGIFFVLDAGENSLYLSLIGALCQFGILIVSYIAYTTILKLEYRKLSILNRENNNNNGPMSIIKENSINIQKFRTVLMFIAISILCFVAFQSFKNVFLLIDYSITYNSNLIPEIIDSQPSFLTLIFVIHVIWAAIAEEAFYRGMFFRELLRKNRICAYILSVMLFSIAHGSIEQVIQALFLAIILCIIFEKTDSLLICIIVHMVYNTLGFINTYIYLPEYGVSSTKLTLWTNIDIVLEAIKLCIIGVIVFTVAVMMICKIKGKELIRQNEKLKWKELIMIIIIVVFSILRCATSILQKI